MFDLQDKVVIITGGANGIGAAAVRSFLDEGAKFVAFIDVNEESGISLEQELVKKHGKDIVKFFNCDVTKDENLFEVFSYMVTNYGCIDLVVNNAGIADDAMYKKEIEINYTAVVTSTLKALEIMRKDHGGPGGTIINISSMGALFIPKQPMMYVYCAAKSAVTLFSASLGAEGYYSHSGVRVITVCFGLTLTNLSFNFRGIDDLCTKGSLKMIEDFVPQSPEEAAAEIVEIFKKGKTGSIWVAAEGKVTDITERVTKAYQIMSGEIQI